MEQKRVSFKVAKAIKEAGYWNPNTTINSQYNNACYADNGRLYPQGCVCDWENVFPAPTYLDVWLWLCDKLTHIEGREILSIDIHKSKKNKLWFISFNCGYLDNEEDDSPDYEFYGNTQEEAIIAAIDYLVGNNLIK